MLSYPESSALIKTMVSEWKPELEGCLPWELSALCPSHTERWGYSSRVNGAPVSVTRPPLEQQEHWDDGGDSEEKPKTRGFGNVKGLYKQRLNAVAPLQVPCRWAWSLNNSVSTCKGCTRQVAMFEQTMWKQMKWFREVKWLPTIRDGWDKNPGPLDPGSTSPCQKRNNPLPGSCPLLQSVIGSPISLKCCREVTRIQWQQMTFCLHSALESLVQTHSGKIRGFLQVF